MSVTKSLAMDTEDGKLITLYDKIFTLLTLLVSRNSCFLFSEIDKIWVRLILYLVFSMAYYKKRLFYCYTLNLNFDSVNSM